MALALYNILSEIFQREELRSRSNGERTHGKERLEYRVGYLRLCFHTLSLTRLNSLTPTLSLTHLCRVNSHSKLILSLSPSYLLYVYTLSKLSVSVSIYLAHSPFIRLRCSLVNPTQDQLQRLLYILNMSSFLSLTLAVSFSLTCSRCLAI